MPATGGARSVPSPPCIPFIALIEAISSRASARQRASSLPVSLQDTRGYLANANPQRCEVCSPSDHATIRGLPPAVAAGRAGPALTRSQDRAAAQPHSGLVGVEKRYAFSIAPSRHRHASIRGDSRCSESMATGRRHRRGTTDETLYGARAQTVRTGAGRHHPRGRHRVCRSGLGNIPTSRWTTSLSRRSELSSYRSALRPSSAALPRR